MSLYAVLVDVIDYDAVHSHRLAGPYRSREAAEKVAEIIRGRVYTRLVKRRGLLGLNGKHNEVRVEATVLNLRNDAAKYHYDWAEEIVLELIDGR